MTETLRTELACDCGKKFTRIENLRRHQRGHLTTSNHVCEQCGRKFTRPDVLQRHLRTHLGHQIERSRTMTPARASRERSETRTDGRLAGIDRPASSLSNGLSSDLQTAWSGNIFPGQLDSQPANDTSFDIGLPMSTPTMWPSTQPPLPTNRPQQNFGSLDDILGAVQPMSSAMPETNAFGGIFSSFPQQESYLAWDDSMLWSMHDPGPLQEIDWTMFGISPQNPATDERALAFLPTGSGLPSRVGSPTVNATAEDEWPTNYKPKRQFVIGMSGNLGEVSIDPATVPDLAKWSDFWLDRATYDRVIDSLATAQRLPNSENFKMPSSLFTVNTLISYYLDKFLPQLPILHLPTFQIRSSPPLLIATFMMIGACQSTIKGARAFAVDLIEVVRRTISDLFELDSVNLRNADLLHVSLLTSFAGLWSGHQRSFELAELSRGMLINLCRRTRLLDCTGAASMTITPSPDEPLSVRWQTWIAAESRKRLGLAIFTFDALFPAFLDMPSYLSQGEMIATVLPSDDRFWNASNAQAWQAQLGVAPIPPAPYFALGITGLLVPKYAKNAPAPVRHLNPFGALIIMNALHHHIWEFRSQLSVYMSLGVTVPFWDMDVSQQPREIQNGFEGRKTWLEGALDVWRKEYYGDNQHDCLSQAGRALYHLGYIALNTNLRDLYAASGKSGPEQAKQVLPMLRQWAKSRLSYRAVSHAARLLVVLEFPKPCASIYAPISSFVAALCLWAFVSFGSLEDAYTEVDDVESKTDRTQIARLFGDEHPAPNNIIKVAVRYLSGCKEWRIGGALALVLAKMVDHEISGSEP